jgi:hypothetical protein
VGTLNGLPGIALLTLVIGAAVGFAFFATASNIFRFGAMLLVVVLAGLPTLLWSTNPTARAGSYLVGAIAAIPAVLAALVAILLAPSAMRRRPAVIVAATVGAAVSVPIVAMAILASGCLLAGACG